MNHLTNRGEVLVCLNAKKRKGEGVVSTQFIFLLFDFFFFALFWKGGGDIVIFYFFKLSNFTPFPPKSQSFAFGGVKISYFKEIERNIILRVLELN